MSDPTIPSSPSGPSGPRSTDGDDQPPHTAPDPARALFERARQTSRTRPKRSTRRKTGAAEVRSGAKPDDRDPQLIGRTVAALLVEQGWQLEVAVRGVLTRWADIVGADVAAHSAPESYADGVLVIRAESTAWATQLRYLAANLVARLNEELGDGTVRTVTVRGPEAPRWTHGPRTVRGRGPRDTYG